MHSAAAIPGLHRRARYRAVGTEHATVARLGAQPDRTSGTVIGDQTGGDRHPLGPGRAAFWAGDDGVEHAMIGVRPLIRNGWTALAHSRDLDIRQETQPQVLMA